MILKNLSNKQLIRIGIVALISFIILSLFYSIGMFSNIEAKLADNLYGGKRPLNNIILVAIDDQSLQELGRWPFDRRHIANAVDNLHEAKVVGIDVAFFEATNDDQQMADSFKAAGNVIIPVEYIDFKRVNEKLVGTNILLPPKNIMDSGVSLAYVNIVTDPDGITRAINSEISTEYETFAYQIFKHYFKRAPPANSPRFLINYVGPPGSFKTVSFADVSKRRIDPNDFKGKIVLIGATSPDLHDDYFVPTSDGKAMPGVEIHANTIQTLINRDYLSVEADWAVLLTIFIFTLLVVLIFYLSPVWLAPLINLLVLSAYLIIAIWTFNYGIIMNILYVPLTIIVSYIGIILYFYTSEKKEREKVAGAFSKYVSPKIIKQVMDDPSSLKLGGEKRNITVFFSDIRGFTTISENLSPEQLVHLLNEYLTAMTDIILKEDGVVDKYMGDAIMAFWNAPVRQPEHALRAVRTSFPSFDIGIGLNTGPAVVGNMGSFDRFDYTAMGDTVNLGARLESINKQYGSRILISETTKKLVEKEFMTRKIDKVAVKGKSEPVTIYELAGNFKEAGDWYQPICDKFEEGLELYFKQEWDKAIKCFKECHKIRKEGAGMEDGPSKTFIERCKAFKESPPPKDWDGVMRMKTK